MKALRCLFLLLIATLVAALPEAPAQWDDLYYDPATDEAIVYGDRFEQQDKDVDWRNRLDDGQLAEEESHVASSELGDANEYYYDYYYSSRIRRFHRPFFGFGFYDPCYVDALFYDPFYAPGVSIYIYDDYDFWRWRRWRRWNRWHSWHHPWWEYGGNVFINNYYYGVYGYNYYNPYGALGGWYGTGYSGWWYGDANTGSGNAYYGARRTGMTKTPRQPVRDFSSKPGRDEPPVDVTPRLSETQEALQPGNVEKTVIPSVRKDAEPESAPAATRQYSQKEGVPSRKMRGRVRPDDPPSTGNSPHDTRETQMRMRRHRVPPAHEPATRTRRHSPAASPNRSDQHRRARSHYRSSPNTRTGGTYKSSPSTRSRGHYNSGSSRYHTRSTHSSRGSYRSNGGATRTRSHSPRGHGN